MNARVQVKAPRWGLLKQLPKPSTRLGVNARAAVEHALLTRNTPWILAEFAVATRVNATERDAAIFLPAVLGAQLWRECGTPLPMEEHLFKRLSHYVDSSNHVDALHSCATAIRHLVGKP